MGKKKRVDEKRTCPFCNGSGEMDFGEGPRMCKICWGSGKV